MIYRTIKGGRGKKYNVQIGEDDVDQEDVFTESIWHERRDEGWEEEDDGHGRLDSVRRSIYVQSAREGTRHTITSVYFKSKPLGPLWI